MHALGSVRSRPFYIGLSFLMGLIALIGFWPSYFGPLVDGSLLKPLRVHVHVVVYVGWLLLFASQATFAALGKIKWHVRLGSFGIGYGVFLIFVGLYTAIVRAALETNEFLGPFLDMVIFALFFGPAVFYRRKPHLHKKLMIVATTMLLVAAVFRMWFLPELPEALRTPILLLIWFLPVILAIGYDYLGRQRIHPIYILGLLSFVFRVFGEAQIIETQAWITFRDAVISSYLLIG